MSQNSYEEFRNFYLGYEKKERLYLVSLDRWLSPLRPFRVGKKFVSQDFNTYYFSRKIVNYSEGVTVTNITRKKGIADEILNAHSSFDAISESLIISSSIARQLSSNSTAFTYSSGDYDFANIIGPTSYLYRTGVESTPFEVFKLLGEGKSHINGNYRFKNKILKTSRYKVEDIPPLGWDFPTGLIYPMLEGPNVHPFCFNCGNNFHIIPYLEKKPNVPVSLEYMIDNAESLGEYFANHRHILEMQSEKSKSMHQGDAFYSLSKIGDYTFAKHLVAARDNSKFCATVVTPTLTPWGEIKQTICVKHTIIISQDVNKNFITEDEAHYINGILNSGIVVSYIHSTFKTNGFSLNKSHLFLPKYDDTNPLFIRIANLSKEATSNPNKRDEIIASLTLAYLDLCRALNPTLNKTNY